MIVPEQAENPPTFDVYQRADGTWVVHIDTLDMPETVEGPVLVVYINDDTTNPIWDNDINNWIAENDNETISNSSNNIIAYVDSFFSTDLNDSIPACTRPTRDEG